MNTHDSERNINKILDSLDGIQRATPGPYFYTRIRARLTRGENGWSHIAGFISRPVYALSMISIVLFINTWIVVRENKEAGPANFQATTEQLPDEYNVAVNSFYDYETPAYE